MIKAEDRFQGSPAFWLKPAHIFNFADHHRPGRSGFGDLLVVNDDHVLGKNGFGFHPHHDMEIVTWMLKGKLNHEDNQGNKGTIVYGEAQQMSAGTGVLHSEFNHEEEEAHLLQMWVIPDKMRAEPRYQQVNVLENIQNNLALIASGEHEAPIHLHNSKASFYAGVFNEDKVEKLPNSDKLYIYVAEGSASVKENSGTTGDSFLIEDAKEIEIEVKAGSHIVVWAVDSHAREQANFAY